ncbi:MAG: hypothetical protein BWY57_03405 [Betaproteobacteria bacterium ADurb.Bin341]|nr:MAG: hypothetical protein BWY57_03405 [Betaproteobacteria bacterium ADurb.Bin341]
MRPANQQGRVTIVVAGRRVGSGVKQKFQHIPVHSVASVKQRCHAFIVLGFNFCSRIEQSLYDRRAARFANGLHQGRFPVAAPCVDVCARFDEHSRYLGIGAVHGGGVDGVDQWGPSPGIPCTDVRPGIEKRLNSRLVVVFLRCGHQRGCASFISGFNVRTSGDQRTNYFRVFRTPRGNEQGRLFRRTLCIDKRSGGEQSGDHGRVMVSARSPHQRGHSAFVACFQIRSGVYQDVQCIRFRIVGRSPHQRGHLLLVDGGRRGAFFYRFSDLFRRGSSAKLVKGINLVGHITSSHDSTSRWLDVLLQKGLFRCSF